MALPAAAAAAAVATAPGKAILLGEHFVVHGAPAVACSIDRTVAATARPLPRRAVRIDSPLGACEAAAGEGMPGGLQGPLAAACLIAVSGAQRAGVGLHLSIDSCVPLGAGLGSSSAWCVAAAAALRAATGEEAGADSVAAAALDSEKAALGSASGVDTAACAYGGFGAYCAGGGVVEGWRRIDAAERLRLVVADTGVPHSTPRMVGAVSRFRDQNRPEFEAMAGESARLAQECERAVRSGDTLALGRCMSKSHALLSRLGVSTGTADTLVKAAGAAGSQGAKITGAGGGGCVIALPGRGKDGEEAVARAMRSAGAAECFVADAGVQGMDVRPAPP